MNILYVVPYVPNLIRVRSFNFIRALTARGHQVTVLTLYSTEAERLDARQLTDMCHEVHALPLSRWRSIWNSLRAILTQDPIQVDYCWHPAFARELKLKIANETVDSQSFDIVHVEHLRGVRYALYAKTLIANNGNSGPPVIWDSVDCISLLFREAASKSKSFMVKAMTGFELKRTEQYEAWVAGQLIHILLTSPRDKESFISLLPPQDVIMKEFAFRVLPNGVDLEYFQPSRPDRREPASIVVTGKMSYHANITMVLHLVNNIMPLIWARRPDALLVIVGKDPSKEIRDLARNSRIRVTGTVKDMRPYLQRASVALASTTYGAGIQNKVLEAMACATPVVASPEAVSAINAVPGRDLLVANDPLEFAECVLDLLDDHTRRTVIGSKGRHFVEANHDWCKLAADLESIYQQAINQVLPG